MWLVKRLALSGLVIWVAVTLAFFALRVLPGDAVTSQLIQIGASETVIEQRQHDLGLDTPVLEQYMRFMVALLQGDLGVSFLDGLPVIELVFQYFTPTASLAVGAMLTAVILGLGLGIAGAFTMPWGISHTARMMVNLALSMPIYWTGTVAIYVATVLFDRFPYAGAGRFSQLILPSVVLGFHTAGAIARVVQINIQQTLHAEFVRTARGKGLPEKTIVWRHVLRVGLLPAVTVIALQAGFLLSGTVITENLFARPGIGQLLLTRTIQQDYPVVQGIVILGALTYTLVNTIAEIAFELLDPRVTI